MQPNSPSQLLHYSKKNYNLQARGFKNFAHKEQKLGKSEYLLAIMALVGVLVSSFNYDL